MPIWAFVVPKQGTAHGDGRSEVDIGRCEPRGGAPRPPPQPTGPMGPLGSRPAHLAPRRAVQAPTPRPIQPGFTTWRPQNPSNMAPARPTNAPKVVLGGPYAPGGPLGSLGWRGARRCTSASAQMLNCPKAGGLIRKPPITRAPRRDRACCDWKRNLARITGESRIMGQRTSPMG